MFNNLTNYFNILKSNRVKKLAEPSDLIPLGTKDDNFTGNRKPTAIAYEDLETQILSQVPASAVNYSKTVFVDATFGNNITGTVQDATKPFLSISSAQAALQSSLLPGEVGLVHIRPGSYTPGFIFFSSTNQIDYHFEDGCIVTNAYWRQSSTCVSNITGYAKFVNTTNNNFITLQWVNTVVNIYCLDIIDTNKTGAAITFTESAFPANNTGERVELNIYTESFSFTPPTNVNSAAAVFQPRAGSIFTFTFNRGNIEGSTWLSYQRSSTNYANYYNTLIKGNELFFNAFTGLDYFGGCKGLNFQNFDSNSTSIIDIKKTVIDPKTSTAFAWFGLISCQGTVGTVNWIGDILIKANTATGIPLISSFASIATGKSMITVKGNVDSRGDHTGFISNTNPNTSIFLEGNFKCVSSGTAVIYSQGGESVNLEQCNIEGSTSDTMIQVDPTCEINIFNSAIKANGTATTSIKSSSPSNTPYLHNVVSNLPVDATVTPLNTAAQFIVDANLRLPKFNV